jgi:hypothetical protein
MKFKILKTLPNVRLMENRMPKSLFIMNFRHTYLSKSEARHGTSIVTNLKTRVTTPRENGMRTSLSNTLSFLIAYSNNSSHAATISLNRDTSTSPN